MKKEEIDSMADDISDVIAMTPPHRGWFKGSMPSPHRNRNSVRPSLPQQPATPSPPPPVESKEEVSTVDPTRPTSWDDYIGQEKLKKRLRVHAAGAHRREERMDHVLIEGPTGCGKTSLAYLIAEEAGVELLTLMAPVNKQGMARLLDHEGMVFIDEIHRMSKANQEELYTLLEDGFFMHPSGVTVSCPDLTILGATTDFASVEDAFRDRFPIQPKFEDYEMAELASIAHVIFTKLEVEVSAEQAIAYAVACGDRPRKLKEFAKMARDLESSEPDEVFEFLGITDLGLDNSHIKYLTSLQDLGTLAGVERIAAMLQMRKAEVTAIEKLLVKHGFIQYHTKGRMLTDAGAKEIERTTI